MPKYSLVVAAYNVADYLPRFQRSWEQQSFGFDQLEVIVVDDGSTDETPALLAQWAEQFPNVRVLTQDNAGQAAARNAGMAVATGDWVSFPDADDFVGHHYVRSVDKFLARAPNQDVSFVATNREHYFEADDRRQQHDLAFVFADGNKTVDLDTNPTHFFANAAAAFFRRADLFERDLRFPLNLRSHYEDGYFCVDFLLSPARHRVGFVADAQYFYRRRRDNSSTTQQSMATDARFAEVPENAYLALCRLAHRRLGSVPVWLQNQILYELSWYFWEANHSHPPEPSPAAAQEFWRTIGQLMAYIETAVIVNFDIRPMSASIKSTLLLIQHANPAAGVVHTARDEGPLGNRYRGFWEPPLTSAPDTSAVVATHTSSPQLWGHDLAPEYSLWLGSDAAPPVAEDELSTGWSWGTDELPAWEMTLPRNFGKLPSRTKANRPSRRRLQTRLVSAAAKAAQLAPPFRRPWVFMGQDSPVMRALFAQARQYTPFPAFWVVNDGQELPPEMAERALRSGSKRALLTQLEAGVVVAHDPTLAQVRPPPVTKLREPRWRTLVVASDSYRVTRQLDLLFPHLVVAESAAKYEELRYSADQRRLVSAQYLDWTSTTPGKVLQQVAWDAV